MDYEKQKEKEPYYIPKPPLVSAEKVFNGCFQPNEMYSRKVFLGGLPADLDEATIRNLFQEKYGPLCVDWPHKDRSGVYPPKGYAFLCFESDTQVRKLLLSCTVSNKKYFVHMSSHAFHKKLVQVRPWLIADSEFVPVNSTSIVDHRTSIFIGGLPRQATAPQLADMMNKNFGNVVHVQVVLDNDFKYPKGAAKVSFGTRDSYAAAVQTRFLIVKSLDQEKRIEMKPYLVENALCDSCRAQTTSSYCSSVHCLAYLCKICWQVRHSREEFKCHKPQSKDLADKSRRRSRVDLLSSNNAKLKPVCC